VPVAAIDKVGVPSVSGGYSAADTFRTIGMTLFDRAHARDVLLLGERFSLCTVLELLTTKVHRSYRKIRFWRKATR